MQGFIKHSFVSMPVTVVVLWALQTTYSGRIGRIVLFSSRIDCSDSRIDCSDLRIDCTLCQQRLFVIEWGIVCD